MDTIKKVKEFHDATLVDTPTDPEFPDLDRTKLRVSLILEELWELAEALGESAVLHLVDASGQRMRKYYEERYRKGSHEKHPKLPNLVEALDALCDLRVVLDGTTLELGMQDVFNEAFERVHSSNMSKTCVSEWDAQKGVDDYRVSSIPTYYRKTKNNRYVILRSSDNKVLKGPDYKPPNLYDLIYSRET